MTHDPHNISPLHLTALYWSQTERWGNLRTEDDSSPSKYERELFYSLSSLFERNFCIRQMLWTCIKVAARHVSQINWVELPRCTAATLQVLAAMMHPNGTCWSYIIALMRLHALERATTADEEFAAAWCDCCLHFWGLRSADLILFCIFCARAFHQRFKCWLVLILLFMPAVTINNV